MQDLHGIVARWRFDLAFAQGKHKALETKSVNTIIELLNLARSIIVLDHCEHLFESPKKFNFLYSIIKNSPNNCSIIITTTADKKSISITPAVLFQLPLPSVEEASEIFAHWVKADDCWIKNTIDLIGVHPFIVRTIAVACSGTYSSQDNLIEKVNSVLTSNTGVIIYFDAIVESLSPRLLSWVSLATLMNGSLILDAIPQDDVLRLIEQGIVSVTISKQPYKTLSFHPLILKSMKQSFPQKKRIESSLNILTSIELSYLVHYYMYICNAKINNLKNTVELIRNHWQEWAEYIGTDQSLSSIQGADSRGQLLHWYESLLYSGIIRLFRGRSSDLKAAHQNFIEILESQAEVKFKIIANIEDIECCRKMNGHENALKLLLERIPLVNNFLSVLEPRDSLPNNDKYIVGTIFFVIGNILRANENFEFGKRSYQEGLKWFERAADGNSALQIIHSHYTIADCELKLGEIDLALAIAESSALDSSSENNFGIALLEMLKAKAYICKNDLDKGKVHLNKAITSFKNLNLPYYCLRCQLIFSVIYIKSNNYNKALHILKNIMSIKDNVQAIYERSYLLVQYINGVYDEKTYAYIHEIAKHCGNRIACSYAEIANLLPANYFQTTYTGDTVILKDGIFCIGKSLTGSYPSPVSWLID